MRAGSYGGPVITVGVDLAADPARTGLAVLHWTASGAQVRSAALGVDDDAIVAAVATADKVGIDCPFGWPEDFVEFVAAHRAGRLAVPDDAGRDWRRRLAYRRTDEVVREITGLIPLSVSADRIAHPAMRCAALLARLAAAGRPVDRAGHGLAVEAYPAAALKLWGLPHRGYKRTARLDGLAEVLDRLTIAAPWLDLGAYAELCRRHDDVTDAVLAAFIARAAALGQVRWPAPEDAARAAVEGWITLPTGPLAALVGVQPADSADQSAIRPSR